MEKGKPGQSVRFEEIPFAKLVFMDGREGRKLNPRRSGRAELEKLARDIEADPTFLLNRPTLVSHVNGQFLVYGGERRARAVGEILKRKTVTCLVEDGVPADVMEARAIKDNTHIGDWDFSGGGWDMGDALEWGVPLGAWESDGDEYQSEGDNSLNSAAPDPDYSAKNKELQPDMEERFSIVLLFSDADFYRVKERLGEMEETAEAILLNSLFPE